MRSKETVVLVETLTPREQEILELLTQGMSNRDVADALVLSINTVKWYNRQVYGKLGVENRAQAVKVARRLGLVSNRKVGKRGPTTLPAPATPFVGRQAELAALTELVLSDRSRLTVIVGPGGVGKTRLALETARQLDDHFADGVAFVNLAPLQTAAAIVPSLAQALGFKPAGGAGDRMDPKTQLLAHLHDKALLIILDNFEHIQDGEPLLVEIAQAAPGTTLLVTSRERVKLQMAQQYRLHGLTISRCETLQQVQQDAAAGLFIRHGQRMRPDFELHESDLPALHRILLLVWGMPLGIILSAAWVELLSVAQIAVEIERSLDFLESNYRDLPERQRSMRAVCESTWSQLRERDRNFFARLSVFRGGFSLAAVRLVTGATPRDLRRLIDRSLVAPLRHGRFEMHEQLRQFAAEQLANTPRWENEIGERHRDYYMTFLSERARSLIGAQAEEGMLAIEADFQNCYAAWIRSVEQGAIGPLAASAFTLAIFSMRTAWLQEGLEAMETALVALRPLITQSQEPDAQGLVGLIVLLALQCALHFESGAFEQAEAFGQEANALLARRELQDVDTRWAKGLALLHTGNVYLWQNRLAEAQPMFHAAVSLSEATGDDWCRALGFHFLGTAANQRADYAQAVQYSRRALRLLNRLDDRYQKAYTLGNLGFALAVAGEDEEAEKTLRDSLAIFQKMGNQAGATLVMLFLAETIAYQGRFEEARTLARESAEEQARLGRRHFAAMGQIRWCLAALHLADYEAVLEQTPGILEVSRANKAAMNLGRAFFLSGSALLALRREEEARHDLEEAVRILREIASWDYLCEGLAALSCAHSLASRPSEAREALHEATELALQVGVPLFFSHVIAASAAVSLAMGDTEKAVERYTLACRHPFVAHSRWWQEIVGRQVAAATGLSEEQTVAARARGKGSDWSDTATAILRDLAATGGR